uniref:Luqin-2 n=1 Tax=Ambigolimax valentianus TaxID=1338344 RepID=A0A2Z6C4M9_9EUPU|nr:luqin-2 [Ambigolimax valentianus]
MNAVQHLKVSCCMLAVVMCTLGDSQPWRPQGRFGKRLSSSLGEGESLVPALSFWTFHEVPVEALFTDKQIDQFHTKPRLCSVSGHQDFPVCEFASSITDKDSHGSDSFFNL